MNWIDTPTAHAVGFLIRIPVKDFVERVYNFLDNLKTKNYESALMVAHSGVSKAFSCYLEGIQDGLLLNCGLKNCEVKEYEL